ncbi:SH3-like domain-containing protein [Leptothoe kymatousa]|uniref:nitrile hydratase n=1 Tax=Leptothoe kymatousa TAU-MAC 1615 TaxID=2364775 RepID=A0ABS5Y325_9CYAN|nr:SH3-like domain-containing protein [Leptothoe kymatousa]MBT9312249.1 nitrile hydratase subunit beta [Leptothoe kymatousa TAU-MAC 1615]
MKEVPPKNYHQPIPHDLTDTTPLNTHDHPISFFEKQITSLHNLMRAKKQLPSFDAVRRAAEEIDGRFTARNFSADIPEFLKNRLPEYGERRILAVETVLCELGYLTREELRQGVAGSAPDAPEPIVQDDYAPEIDTETYGEPRYHTGDLVQVIDQPKPGHIRTPVYLFGKKGKIANLQGLFANPEDLAHFKSKVVHLPLYLVEFDMVEVWGEQCPKKRSLKDKLRVEIYEPWLIPL